ncbi:MAG: pirin family protein [Acidobacteriota bacterium]|nr:pirin family protein [Acidobacteriota bacterium]MDH3529171.1 pirin family protein [Acidobacteriota bacterium]
MRRSIGTRTLSDLDPFLLFDHFGSDDPEEYIAGFPMHPHRGIETVTYMLEGRIRHRDSVGNSGIIDAGGVQWMTAGSGIMHEEMPEMKSGRLEGFQLWVNLKSYEKLTRPSYREFDADEVPSAVDAAGNRVKVIAGSYGGIDGAVKGISANPIYLDVSIRGNSTFEFSVAADSNVFAYVYRGTLERPSECPDAEGSFEEPPYLLVFDGEGEKIELQAGKNGTSLIIAGGSKINEPIVRYGPFVMNTEDEIEKALEDLRSGTFVSD